MSLFLILIIILLLLITMITFSYIIEILGDSKLTKSKTFLTRMKILPLKPLHSYDNFIITAGVAVLLTILTMLSTPILTAIFGDGSLEVRNHKKYFQNYFQPGGGYRGLGK